MCPGSAGVADVVLVRWRGVSRADRAYEAALARGWPTGTSAAPAEPHEAVLSRLSTMSFNHSSGAICNGSPFERFACLMALLEWRTPSSAGAAGAALIAA